MQSIVNFARWSFLPLIVISVLPPVFAAKWETYLDLSGEHSGSRHIISGDRAPLWNPPEAPDYQVFRNRFSRFEHQLPATMPEGAEISQGVLWGQMFEETLLWIWRGMVVISVFYLCVRRRCHDHLLDVIGCSTVGICSFVAIAVFVHGWSPEWSTAYIIPGALTGMVVGLFAPRIGHERAKLLQSQSPAFFPR